MSRRNKGKVSVAVKARPIPVNVIRAQAIGESVGALGGSDDDVLTTQKGILAGMLAEITVYGLDGNGNVRDAATFNLSADQAREIELDLQDGQRSALEALDGSLARSVQYAAERMTRRGLTVSVRWRFHDSIYADEVRLAQCRAHLGTSGCEAPQWRQGYRGQQVVRIKPAKDQGFG
ncbi:MAG: hypothetical protein ABL897_04325, partial [Hyphomicrobium sp.]